MYPIIIKRDRRLIKHLIFEHVAVTFLYKKRWKNEPRCRYIIAKSWEDECRYIIQLFSSPFPSHLNQIRNATPWLISFQVKHSVKILLYQIPYLVFNYLKLYLMKKRINIFIILVLVIPFLFFFLVAFLFYNNNMLDTMFNSMLYSILIIFSM